MAAMSTRVRVTVWNENVHEHRDEDVRVRYPDGIHGAIRAGVERHLPDAVVRTATLDQPEHGLYSWERQSIVATWRKARSDFWNFLL